VTLDERIAHERKRAAKYADAVRKGRRAQRNRRRLDRVLAMLSVLAQVKELPKL